MKKLFVIAAVFLLLSGVLLAATKIADDPVRLGVGARPLGLGKAYIGLADDVNAIFMNPAGLAQLKQWQITSLQGKFVNEVNYLTVGLAVPVQQGVFGIGYLGSNLGYTTSSTSIEGGRVVSDGSTVSYADYDHVMLFSYAFPLNPMLSGGATLKMFSKNLSGTSQGGASASGYDVDLGLMFKPSKPLNLGLALTNILPASFGGRIVWNTGVIETFPATLKGGLSLKVWGKEGLRKMGNQKLTFNLDGEYYPTQTYLPSLFHVGVEWQPIKFLAIRGGIDQEWIGTGNSGLGVSNNLTGGIGLFYREFRFDYAYHQFNATPGVDNHFFALSYGIPLDKDDDEPSIIMPVGKAQAKAQAQVRTEAKVKKTEIKPVKKPIKKPVVIKKKPIVKKPIAIKKKPIIKKPVKTIVLAQTLTPEAKQKIAVKQVENELIWLLVKAGLFTAAAVVGIGSLLRFIRR